ncbi:MAG TPA: tetratricopeptide repeat protein [Gemmatimonadaceae bacterium]|nr:tetratricopeptide repeat protein [Gemmatimonadaceae bacterium]
MTLPDRERATEHLRLGDMAAALAEFRALCDAQPDDWYAWYGAGQAARFLNDFHTASVYLSRAAELAPTQASVHLALGIADQLQGEFPSAVQAFGRAISLDADFAEAFNSLAITQRKMGQFDKALHNFNAGRQALACRLVKRMRNDVSTPIVQLGAPIGTKWIECATFGALWLASEAGAASVSWPTPESAIAEEDSGAHGGLFYIDRSLDDGFVRSFLPNYFATFRRWLQEEPIFAHLVGNEGTVWERLGQLELAEQCFTEARAFGDPTRGVTAWTK